MIWEAFGTYVAKQLRSGKGVWVPKFGQFSFTGMNVDLAVSISYHNRELDNNSFSFQHLHRDQQILMFETVRSASRYL